jgi:hypothetical protein
MSITPRTDAALEWVRPVGNDSGPPHEQYVEANFARDLERENAALRAIIDATLRALPVGNVRTHTPDSIPERVGDLVKAHADELADNEQLRKDNARLRAALERIVALGARMPEDAEEVCIAKAALSPSGERETRLIGTVEELRKDKARLDWLADPKNTIGNVTLPTQHIMDHPDSMRAAIDAAMGGDK